ncbi:MAG: porin [Bacteriovoracaceae bacterium]|nr:porin [Bacteriovoracaceae bacterium]
MKAIFLGVLLTLPIHAEAISSVNFGGFIDTYYALDSNNPSSRERATFQTQPAKHNEFNLNLAYMEAVLKEDERRGRLALQYGTSVDRNYAYENNKSLQTIQEAYGGIKLSDKLWLEAGIFFSHIGIENFISKNNTNYSRSLNADNIPYYSSGVRFEYQASKKDLFHLHIINGWQNIQENNTSKALGIKYQRTLDATSTFVYNNFLGDEKVTTPRSRFRTYQNFIFEKKLNERWKLQSSFDVGTQAQLENDGVNSWYATSLILGQKLNEVSKVGYRAEYYLDRDQSNIATGTPNGFQVASASVNYDRVLAKETVWRSEVRGFYSKDEIFPQGSSSLNEWDWLVVTSLSLSF